ncbi:helix-turn-helix domain-containing protein [uncultured Dysosmobacter sp.]|uniref:helix-turn-helix domain-containing protein n=1 Tax=uncultured Dysosmobacter sp. TaxID=2591384 RepID=UPI002620ECCF|nr:helix-turn-helix domain-containing protein [uncultured Dysosmobacter sp.]
MRKHRVPLGWPRRDPRCYRFPVSNEVWEYKLQPTEFVILSYICYQQTHGREEKKVSAQAVADSLRLTAATAEKHLATLVSKGLITENGTLSSKRETGKFFSLPNEVFLLALPSTAFLVYAYLLYCEDRRTHQCHPSYRTIARATGLSLNTVVKSVGVLAERTLITMEGSCWFNEVGMKRNGNNVYTIRPIREAVDHYNEQQLHRLDAEVERQRVQARLSRLCAPQEPLSTAGRPRTPPTT